MTTSIIGDGEKIITTVLLNGERIHVRVHAHANAQSVFDAVVQYVGLTEVRYFGLMIIKDSEQQFLALDEKLSKLAKYAPHLWKDDGSCNSSLVFTIFFRVKFYVENICLLQEQQTRHQYYLQLRKDVLENAIRIHDDTSMVLASYALQTELGDYDKSVHHGDYFVPQHYLPAKTIAKLTIPYIKTALPAMHQSHRGLTEGQSEIEFLKEAQKLSEYGVLFHRVYRNEFNKKLPYNLGICVRGLVVYEETGPVRNPVCKHPWVKVKKMSFKRSKFIIEADSPNPSLSKMTLYTANYKRSRYLLKISSSFFNFQMKMVSKIALLPENMTPEPLVAPTPPPASIPSVRIDAAKPPLPPLPPSVKPTPAKTTVAAMTPGKTTLTTESKPQTPKPEAKQYTLDLIKRDGSFGFSIVGGIELGGIFVKDVTQGGPAALSNQINAGDRIVQINKDSFESVTRREAINTLRNAPEKSKFIMETFGQNLIMEADASFNTPFSIQAPTLPAPPVTLALPLTQQQLPPVVVHQQQQASEKEADLIRAELVKRDNTFGLVFTGGPEIGGLYVTSLLPHGSAEIDARIAVGDRVLEVAQTNVENFTKKKLQERLKQMQGSTTFVMERYKQLPSNGALMYIDREKVLRSSPNFISITLSKKNDSLGFSITGGLPLAGIFVKYINPNGPAANDTRLEIGDRVVAVNDISLETSGRQKALEILRNTTSPVNLIIEKFGNNVIPMATMAVPGDQGLVRSDSIKSLPVHRGNRPNVDARSSLNYSMQHLANTLPPARGRQFCGTDTGVAGSPGGSYTNGGNQLSSAVVESKTNNRKSVSPEVFLVELVKQNGSFGLSLTGGPNLGGIYIKALHPNAPADLDARVRRGDRVVEINTRRMDGLTRQEATDWLKASPSNASLIVERLIPAALQTNNHPFETPPPHQSTSQYSSFDGEFLHVQLHRKNNTFGICLAGGQEQRGIFIKKLMTNGSAALDGRIGKGDKVLEINSFSLDAMTRQQATELLNQSPVLVHLLIEKVHLNCEELTMFDHDFYTVELRKSDSGFGFSITGGADLGGIYVKGILPGGTADSSRKIQKGDRIVETNGVSFEGLTKQQACEVLRKFSGVNVSMVMEKAAVFDNIVIPESDYFTVELHKKNNGYGLNLTGGPEIDGVYVKQVQRESSADQDGRIKKGDRLITINGRNVENSTRQKCTEMLKLTQDIAVLHLERCVVGDDLPPLDTVLAVVKLTKSTSGFGISLTGGPEIGGIFVKALMAGGCAEKDGRIFVGDRLAEMNSQSFDGLTRQQATELLKNSPAVATFVLERYKAGYKQRQLLNRSGSTEFSHQNNNAKIRNNSVENKTSLIPHDSNSNNNNINNDQHFSFPLYTGAAPSVPPRHNGSVGRESAFKRYEQVAAQRQQPNNTNENTHNVQGATVSSHLSTFMRQQSTERQHQQQLVVDNKPTYATVQRNKPNEEQPFPTGNTAGQENMPFSLVEGPMRMHVTNNNNNNNTIIDDSPQRFLQKFSKQVTTPENSNIAVSSRIPLGPISSAIFGGQRDSRNVHELLDPAEKHFDGVRYILNNNNEILRAPQDPRDFLLPGSDYVPPRSSHQAPNAGDYVPPRASHQTPTSDYASSRSNHQPSTSDYVPPRAGHQTMPAPPQQTVVTIHNGRPNNASADVKATHTTAPATEIYKPNKKDTLMAATMSPGNPNDIKKSQGNLRYEDTRPLVTNYEEATPVQHRSAPVMSAKRMPPSLHSDNRPVVSPHQPKQQETTIPVPLASKYSTTPPKSKLGEDIVFEVTLFKGQYGLGMNLTGGGLESPITIKKIAPGTAADESGQLKVGDVVLEVNGRKVSHLTSKEVISILRACGNEVQLLVKRVFHNTPQNLNTPF